MKVDQHGNPVSEGAYGLWREQPARVERTFVNPVEDDKPQQKIIAAGGYVIVLGDGSQRYVSSTEFVLDPEPDKVKAQDGREVQPGDKVAINDGSLRGTYTVRNVYPTSKLKEFAGISIKESKGGAPDGYYAVNTDKIEKVVSAPVASTASESADFDVLGVEVGDVVRFTDDNGNERIGEITSVEDGDWSVSLIDSDDYGLPESFEEGETYYINSEAVLGYAVKPEESDVPVKVSDRFKLDDWIRFRNDDDAVWEGVIIGVLEKPMGSRGWDLRVRLTKTSVDNGESTVADGAAYMVVSSKVIEHRRPGAESAEITGGQAASTSSSEGRNMAETSEAVARNRAEKFGKITINREGSQINLPENMTFATAIAELTRQKEQEEMDVNVMEIVDGHPLDAAYAFVKALENKFGWVNSLPTPGFFGPKPPTMVGVQIDSTGKTVQIPWGKLGIPGVTGTLATGIQYKDGLPVFCIQGTIKQKDKGVVGAIAQMAREWLRDNSIYKGKAIRVRFPSAPGEFSPLDNQPKFIPTTETRPEELIFSSDVERQVQVNLWTLIQHQGAVRSAKVPLKRGILVHGKYGVGKTLLAAVTARMCVQAGTTFIDLEDSNQLPSAIQFGRQLGGMVVIFAEDIDRCDQNGTRTDAFNEILNTVDGLTSKTDEVVIVMTTNHIERISKAMLRPGRLDAVIEVHPPDAEAVQRLIRLYARHLLDAQEDIRDVGALLAGEIPAVVREVVERSKLAAISRGEVSRIVADDLQVQALGMRAHLELLKEEPRDDRSELEKLGDAMGRRLGAALIAAYEGGSVSEVNTEDEDMKRVIDGVVRRKQAA